MDISRRVVRQDGPSLQPTEMAGKKDTISKTRAKTTTLDLEEARPAELEASSTSSAPEIVPS